MKAPAFSLMIGASLVALPPMYYSLSSILKRNTKRKVFDLAMSLINISIFITIVIYLLTSIDMVATISTILNTTNISDDAILYGNREEFLIKSIIVLIALLIVYILGNKEKLHTKANKYLSIAIYTIVASLLIYQTVSLSMIMIYRTQSLATPTFDFALFVQMFHNMKNFGTMVTTLERSVELSHLSIHFSPIFYLMLPVFMVFPTPETLQVLQILIVAIGVIPIYLIAKTFKLSSFVTSVVLVIYIFNPAIISSSFYDLHENCFLAPLLLFVIYFIIRQKPIPLLISVALTLLIKEDASIYLVVIGFFSIFGFTSRIDDFKQKRRNIMIGSIIIIVSVMYFLVVTKLLANSGEGVMFWRYDNLNGYSDMGILGIIITLFQKPSYLLATMFSPDKIYHLVILMFTLGVIPLLSRKLFDYILMIPLVVFNFATIYPYQHQFGYQYYYGSVALLIFMILLVFKDNSTKNSNSVSITYFKIPIYLIAIASLTVFGVKLFETKDFNRDNYENFITRNMVMKEFLLEIPGDKKVLATGYLTTYLADREVLYDIQFFSLSNTDIVFDYIIIDLRVNQDRNEVYEQLALSNGYVESDLTNEYLQVFVPETE
ncbi:MAG: DUF2079 domain-containing protein [Tenericutes bacterium]|nr:DUF2079 domain-containing protein [Mycoplasmatota bacterium]